MIEPRCPLCNRIIPCKIDEAKGELETFVATNKFLRDALHHYRKHTWEEFSDYLWNKLIEQVKQQLK